MLEEHHGVAVHCSQTNMSDKQRQPTNTTTNMAQMGSSMRGSSSTPNETKVNNNKDASNGAVTKSSRAPRYGGGRRRPGSKGVGIKGESTFSGAGQKSTPYESKQDSKTQNLRKYQNGQASFEASARQTNYNPKFDKVMKDDEFEAGSIFNPGSKKQNLSHLLNFQYEPRGNKNKLNRNRDAYHGGTTRKGAQYHAPRAIYNKEKYLQANCQFVVRKGLDYARHLKDPDIIVEWDQIEQVRLKTTSDVPSCPICLYPPTAAKITKCGHVYCWTCILHYLSLSDEKWRKCPICFESVGREDLKSVVSVPWKELKTNDEIEMKLMRRERNSLFALPVTEYTKDIDDKGHPDVNEKINSYSQLVLASPEQVHKYITSKEQAELETKFIELKSSDDATICYVEEALNYLAERQTGIIRKMSEVSDISDDCGTNDKTPSPSFILKSESNPCWTDDLQDKEDPCHLEARARHASSSSEGMSSSEVDGVGIEEPFVTAEDLDISVLQPFSNYYAEQNVSNQQTPRSGEIGTKAMPFKKANETFYFYQSSDGQPIFLHALNVQMLVKEFGSFEACPTMIKGLILEKDGSNMTNELRNKLRFLKHVPLTCSFEVAELALNNHVISTETRDIFAPQLEQRKRKRAQRARVEKRREKRIEVEENKLMGKYPGLPKSLRIESDFHFPTFENTTATKAIGSSSNELFHSSESGSDSVSSRTSSPQFDIQGVTQGENIEGSAGHAPISSQTKASSGGISFAKMLRHGSAKPTNAANTMSKSETFPGMLSLYPTPTPRKTVHSDSEPELEDYLPPPPKQSIGDALAQALHQSCSLDSGNTVNENMGNCGNQGNGKKKGKKFKGKKISLSSGARPNL